MGKIRKPALEAGSSRAASGSASQSLHRTVSTASGSKPRPAERPKFKPSIMALQRRGLLTEGGDTQLDNNAHGKGKGKAKAEDDGDLEESKEEAKKRHGISLAYKGDPSV